MKKIILILILLLFVTACNTGETTTSGKPDGLHIEFIQPKEGSSIVENSEFQAYVRIYNGADFEIEGPLCLSDLFGSSRGVANEDCQFISIDETSYGEMLYSFGPYTYTNIVSEPNEIESTFYVDITYPVAFSVTPLICVEKIKSRYNPDDEENLEGDCRLDETLTISTEGFKSAPITVSKIRKRLNLYKNDGVWVELEVHLKEMSHGGSDSSGNIDGPFNINLNFAEGTTTCDEFKLSENTEKIINCDIYIDSLSQPSVEDILTINMDYSYYQKETLKFNVVDGGTLI